MRAVLRFVAGAFLLCVSAVAMSQQTSSVDVRHNSKHSLKAFVGTWKLVSSLETLPDGTVRPYGFGPHPAGVLMYDAAGNMCAQVVNTDRPKWKDPDKPLPEEIKTAFDGFGGYCGTYTVDEAAGTMAHHPEVSFDPNLVDQSKPRSYRFEGNRLIYSGNEDSNEGKITWVMTWEKVK